VFSPARDKKGRWATRFEVAPNCRGLALKGFKRGRLEGTESPQEIFHDSACRQGRGAVFAGDVKSFSEGRCARKKPMYASPDAWGG